jgi:fucose 4-O-acetylase-like acetyltransferase
MDAAARTTPAYDLGPAAGRNRYADLLRILAIAAVASGHWLLTDVTYTRGQLSGLDAIGYVSWAGWLTLLFQVMPVFFLVGGYVHAGSWTRRHERGEHWGEWVRKDAMALLWPTTVYVTVAFLGFAVARMAGVGATELDQAGWLVALQLWFLPVYLLLIVLTPAMLAAHRRWGLAVPAVMALGAGAVDIGVVGARVHVIGYANYLLAYAAAQTGLVLAAAPAVSRLLERDRWGRLVTRLNPAVMLVYLWHMVPVIIVAIAFYPTGIIPQPRIGTAEWWELRPAWVALLAVILVPLITGLLWVHRPLLRVLPTGLAAARPWSPALLVAGLAAAGFGLTKLAIGGFAPGGRLPALAIGAYACGLLLTLLSGPPPPARDPRPRDPVASVRT